MRLKHDLRALGVLVDRLDDRAQAIADVVVLGARLLAAGQHRLDAADLGDDVAGLEALDRCGHHLADALAVLLVDLLALGFARLLRQHLLDRLRGDARLDRRLRELDLHVDLGLVAVHLLGVDERDLGGRVGHFVDDVLDREDLNLAGLGVHARAQVLGRLVGLA